MANEDEWELQPTDSSPFQGRVTPAPASDPYANLTSEQLRAAGLPTMESYSPSLAEGLGDTANRGLQALGASRGYGQEFGAKLSGLAGVAPIVGDLSSAQDNLKAGQPAAAAANVLGMFLGPGAKLANLGKLERAMKLAKEGWDTDSVRMATGWHQGAEGGWRFEIPDDRMEVDQAGLAQGAQPLHSVVDHNALFQNYPDLKSYLAETFPGEGRLANTLGLHDRQNRIIGLNDTLSPEEARSTMAHELQHAVQSQEGWEGGSNPAAVAQDHPGLSDVQARDIYRRNAGEVEARNTQNRLNMSALQRMATGPTRTQSVSTSRQLLSRGRNWTLKPVIGDPFEEDAQ